MTTTEDTAQDGTEIEQDHPFDVARDSIDDVNAMLADTDGAIAAMELDGAIGHHLYIAEGETDPEYLWKVAFLQALDRSVLEMAYVDGVECAADARHQLERQVGEKFDSWVSDDLFNRFEDNLASLIEVQEGRDA